MGSWVDMGLLGSYLIFRFWAFGPIDVSNFWLVPLPLPQHFGFNKMFPLSIKKKTILLRCHFNGSTVVSWEMGADSDLYHLSEATNLF